MAEELPAWLAEMRDQQLGQLEQEPPLPEPATDDAMDEVQELPGAMDWFNEPISPPPEDVPPDPTEQVDVLEGLREQISLAEEEFGQEEEGSPLGRAFAGLRSWQRFVLAILLFLDVALCGCMALLMAGRVGLPF